MQIEFHNNNDKRLNERLVQPQKFSMSDTMFAQYAISQDIMNNTVMSQWTNFTIWQCFLKTICYNNTTTNTHLTQEQ